MIEEVELIENDIISVRLLLSMIDKCSSEIEANSRIKDVDSLMIKLADELKFLDERVYREGPFVRQEINPRIVQLNGDYTLLKCSVDVAKSVSRRKFKEIRESNELFCDLYNRRKDTKIDITFDNELQLNNRLKTSTNLVDGLITQGMGLLKSIEEQKQDLFQIRRKFTLVAKTIGLSNSTIRIIDKRVRDDFWIFLIGCVLCLIFMFSFYMWLKQ